MKKLFFALACVIGLLTFASCNPDELAKPTVQFISGEGYTAGSTSVYVGSELSFLVKIAPSSLGETALSHFDFSITNLTGETIFNDNPEIDDVYDENHYEYTYTFDVASTYLVTATVTDATGKFKSAAITINVALPIESELGTYDGLISINGHATTSEVVGYTYDDDYDMTDLPITVTLGAIDDENYVVANIEIDGNPVSLYGNLKDGVITFEEFHFIKTINLIVDVNIDLIMDITGTFEEDGTLTIEGTTTGTGSTQLPLGSTLEATYNGNISGNLEQIAK